MASLLDKITEQVEHIHARIRPRFEEGPWKPLWPLYEAVETFALTPADVTTGSPHIRDALDLKRTMSVVILALLPCVIWGIFNAGYMYNTANGIPNAGWLDHFIRGSRIVLPIIIVSYVVGGLWEVLFAIVRKHEISEGFFVTGLLFPLTLPPTIPLWQVAVGISFGVVIGKEIFGGTGFNVVNPALAARAFLYFAYPAQMTGDAVWVVTQPDVFPHGYTGATALAAAKSTPPGTSVFQALQDAGFSFTRMAIGLEPGSIGETSAIAVGVGMLILLVTGIASWRIIAGGILGTALTVLALNHLSASVLEARPILQLPFYYDLVMGGMFFGIVFMATDPVSSAATNPGKWIYGFLVGFMTVLIRAFNPAFPAGNMLAIIFANIMAPLIDQIVLAVHIRYRARWRGVYHHAKR